MLNIRAYQQGDENGFLALDQALEEHPWNRRNLANWQWKYQGPNPAGKAIIYLAEDENKMIAHFAALPMRYWIGGQQVLASHSIAMMVLPQWQNRGLIKFVADKVLAELDQRQIAFTYGYPNDNAYQLHRQMLGYQDVGQQQLFACNQIPTAKTQNHHYQITAVKEFDHNIDLLWERIKNQHQALVIRDRAFLNWRYCQRPDISYQCYTIADQQQHLGYCVLKLYQEAKIKRGHIIDFFVDKKEPGAAQALFYQAMDYFAQQQCNEVNLWAQAANDLQSILKDNGFKTVSSRPFICRFPQFNQQSQQLLKAEEWLFMMGDTLEIY